MTTEFRTAGIATVELPTKPAVKVEPQLLASVQRPVQQSPSVPISGGVIGTLTVTDGLTKAIRRQDVTVLPSDGGRSLYSTGDMVTQDGQVLQVFMGDWTVRVVSGALWTIPVKAGATGTARVADIGARGDGSLTWIAVAVGGGKVRIDATLSGLPTQLGGFQFSMSGLWQAVYTEPMALPESFSLRARNAYGTVAAASAEFKLR